MSRTKDYDLSAPWNAGVNGRQVLPLINDDAPVIRVEAGPGTGKTFGLVRRVVRLLHPDGLACSGRKVAVYDDTGKLVETHEKFPVDKGHQKV